MASFLGFQQNTINQNLIDLNYIPAVVVLYKDGQFRAHNTGDKSFYANELILDKTPDNEKILSAINNDEGVLVAPRAFHSYPADYQEEPLKSIIASYKKTSTDQEISFPVDLLLMSMTKKKYIARNVFSATAEKDGLSNIRMRMIGVIENNW